MIDDNHYIHNRNKDFQAQLKHINYLCQRLHKLSLETDPMRGETTEEEKDFKAFQALGLVGNIFKSMAQWAIDHQIGTAHEGFSFIPNQPSQTTEHPDYLAARKEVNSHRHELLGAKLRDFENYETKNYSGELLRNIIKNIMIPNSLCLPDSIHSTYLEAFKAIELKAIHPFFDCNIVGHANVWHRQD